MPTHEELWRAICDLQMRCQRQVMPELRNFETTTEWYLPDPGEHCPPGCVDLESMSDEEIDAYFDREEQRLADM